MVRHVPTTRNGYGLDVVISGLQKSIRRGDEEIAMGLMYELVPRYEVYAWKRLVVIAMEDIGIGELRAFIAVKMLRDTYFEFREAGKSGPARLAMANAILTMCRAKKSRIADHFQCSIAAHIAAHGPWQIPDYAYDKHTSEGKRKGRGVDHWLEEGCKLSNNANLEDPYEPLAEAAWKEGWRGWNWGTRSKAGSTVAKLPFGDEPLTNGNGDGGG